MKKKKKPRENEKFLQIKDGRSQTCRAISLVARGKRRRGVNTGREYFYTFTAPRPKLVCRCRRLLASPTPLQFFGGEYFSVALA